jgi:hypothetical protein
MSGRLKAARNFEAESAHKVNAAHEADHLVQMVRSGQLTIDQARALIGVNEGEAVVLRKLLVPYNALVALRFRRAVLRAFDALVDTKMRTRRR